MDLKKRIFLKKQILFLWKAKNRTQTKKKIPETFQRLFPLEMAQKLFLFHHIFIIIIIVRKFRFHHFELWIHFFIFKTIKKNSNMDPTNIITNFNSLSISKSSQLRIVGQKFVAENVVKLFHEERLPSHHCFSVCFFAEF